MTMTTTPPDTAMGREELLRQSIAASRHTAQADGVVERQTLLWLCDEAEKAAAELSTLRAKLAEAREIMESFRDDNTYGCPTPWRARIAAFLADGKEG